MQFIVNVIFLTNIVRNVVSIVSPNASILFNIDVPSLKYKADELKAIRESINMKNYTLLNPFVFTTVQITCP